MAKSRNILPPKRWWTAKEEAYMREHYADTLTVDIAARFGMTAKRVLAKANAMGLHKSRELIAETARQRSMSPDYGGRRTQIKPGQAPWNKGVPGSTGTHPNTRATQFKPGMKTPTWKPIGSYRVVEGQLQVKVNDLQGPSAMRWHPVSRVVWEAAHGPIPDGHKVVFKPGRATLDPALITLDAIELVSCAELMRRNSYHTTLPPELARVVHLRAVLSRVINRKTKEAA
jgi:hypothetical protein